MTSGAAADVRIGENDGRACINAESAFLSQQGQSDAGWSLRRDCGLFRFQSLCNAITRCNSFFRNAGNRARLYRPGIADTECVIQGPAQVA